MENAFGHPQHVIVLGGTSDIARAITKKLCSARANTVVLAGRNQSLLDQAASEALDYGATKTDTVLFDAKDPSSAKRVVAEAFDKVGDGVDLVLVAVGMLANQLVDENDADVAAEVASVNFTWPVAALAEVRRQLVAQGSGRILVLSSVTAVRVRRGAYLYAGAKAGLDRLCDAMADSLVGTGVTLQIVRPGFVRSKMTSGQADIPFSTDPDVVALNVMKGIGTTDRVIWSPPILRYIMMVLLHLPKALWLKVADR